MPNVVVTSTTNSIKVVFNDYAAAARLSKAVWRKDKLRFGLKDSDTFVEAIPQGEGAFAVSFDGSTNTLQIDTVDGVAPTSNSDLYDKLAALIA